MSGAWGSGRSGCPLGGWLGIPAKVPAQGSGGLLTTLTLIQGAGLTAHSGEGCGILGIHGTKASCEFSKRKCCHFIKNLRPLELAGIQFWGSLIGKHIYISHSC